MDIQTKIPILQAIVTRERDDGCPMADESLIESAFRRWRTYERRFAKHRDKSLEHRADDLVKGWIEKLFPDHTYDKSCLKHIALSFAEVLQQDSSAAAHSVTGFHTAVQ